jgi:putative endonuclease
LPDPRHLLGQRAEDTTATWLTTRGWTILARRWRCPEGELDLVALDPGGVLVAIEVKLRSSGRTGDPLESVDARRLRRLRAALSHFRVALTGSLGDGMRVDLVVVRPIGDGRWRLAHHRSIDGW